MHTEYHRYNLKRKIASLPPLSLDVYEGSVAKPASTISKQGPGDAPELSIGLEKTSMKGPLDKHGVEETLMSSRCLFCNVESPTLHDNLQHMEQAHGMFVPERESLEDAEGLFSYLFTVIHKFHECLYCGKLKDTASGIKSHMIDRGHCMIAFGEELDQFYDFEREENEAPLKHDGSNVQETENVKASEPQHNFHPETDQELYLPSGRTLGHRSLARYYRQNLHSYPTPAERAARRAITASTVDEASPLSTPTGRQLTTMSRHEMGMIGVGDFERRALRATEKKALKQETKARNHFEAKVNKEANHQKHFRPAGPERANG